MSRTVENGRLAAHADDGQVLRDTLSRGVPLLVGEDGARAIAQARLEAIGEGR